MTLTRNLSSPLVYTSAKVLLMSLWGVASCQAFSFLVGSHFSGLKLTDIFNIYNIYYYIIIYIIPDEVIWQTVVSDRISGNSRLMNLNVRGQVGYFDAN